MNDQIPMLAGRGLKLTGRWMATLLAISSWLVLSSHCALANLAGTVESAPQTSGCPMHSSKPKEKKPAAKTPCCKNVRAVLAKCVSANTAALRLLGSQDDAPEFVAPPTRLAVEIRGLDTGPPGRSSFAESVLQESLLAHAPPLS